MAACGHGDGPGALREEAAAIRRNLEEMAADRALGVITRAQMLAGTGRANVRLGEIEAGLERAGRENVLAPLVAAQNAAAVWEDLDLSRQRAVIRTLMTITVLPPGRVPARLASRDGRSAGLSLTRGPRAAQEERERVALPAGERGHLRRSGRSFCRGVPVLQLSVTWTTVPR